MSISRVSSAFIVDRGVFNIQNNQMLMNRLQEKIASGKNISTPSDAPVELTQLLRLDLGLVTDERFKKNIDDASGEMNASDVAINGIINVTHRVRELAVQAANSVNSPQQLNAVAEEIDGIINHLLQLGNTTFAGRYIYSGFMTDTSAFTRTGNDITYNGSPNTTPQDYQRSVEIARGSTVPININGDDLLGNVTTAGTTVTGGQGLFRTLTQLKFDLQNQDFDQIRLRIDDVVADQQNILQRQTLLGGRINQLELTKARIEDRYTVQAQQVANIQEVNMPAAISNLNFQQTIYQASLGMMARIMQTSLVNFLS